MSLDVKKVRYISLIRMEGGESILSIPYAELSVDPDLIAGFVTAVIIYANTPIRTIRKAGYDILIEVGETVLVLLVVTPVPDEAPYRKKLKRILAQVEEKYGNELKRFEGDVRRYRELALDIIVEFPFNIPAPNLVPVKKKMGIQIPFRVGVVDKKTEQLEAFINGKKTVEEILNLIDLPDEEVVALLSMLARYKWIDYKKRLTEKDTLQSQDCSDVILASLKQQFGVAVDEVLHAFRGGRQISAVMEDLPYDTNAIWFLINKLLDARCLSLTGLD
ncbi:MAG: hypothetical protein ACTSYL_04735 [Candidatus Thorarchaeota archaeon]